MLMLLALNILNGSIIDKEERSILKEYKDYLMSINFDVEKETIDSQNSINEFRNFCNTWLTNEFRQEEIRDFKKCYLLSNLFLILHNYHKQFNDKVYIYRVKKDYLRTYHDVVKNITEDSNFFFNTKEEESDDNDLNNFTNSLQDEEVEEPNNFSFN